jgi:hypothetical protein
MTEEKCIKMKRILGAIQFSSDGVDTTMNLVNENMKCGEGVTKWTWHSKQK